MFACVCVVLALQVAVPSYVPLLNNSNATVQSLFNNSNATVQLQPLWVTDEDVLFKHYIANGMQMWNGCVQHGRCFVNLSRKNTIRKSSFVHLFSFPFASQHYIHGSNHADDVLVRRRVAVVW